MRLDQPATYSKINWRKRVGVEPTGDGLTRRPPVLKTGTITGPHALPQHNNQMPRTDGVSTDRAGMTA